MVVASAKDSVKVTFTEAATLPAVECLSHHFRQLLQPHLNSPAAAALRLAVRWTFRRLTWRRRLLFLRWR